MSGANTSHQIEEQRQEHSQKGSELKSCRNKLWKRRAVGVGALDVKQKANESETYRDALKEPSQVV